MNYDVITTTDKAKRDEIFAQMRASDDPLERASVKFSGNEPTGELREVRYTATRKGGGTNHGRIQIRPVYRSTWSVATPRPKPGY
jgi:hypothetical protein